MDKHISMKSREKNLNTRGQELLLNERPEIDQRIGQIFESQEMRFLGLKTDQKPSKFIFPGKRPFHGKSQGIDHLIPETWTPPFRSRLLAIAGILFDIRKQPAIKNFFPVCPTIKARIQIDRNTPERHPHRPDDAPQFIQRIRKQHHIWRIGGVDSHRSQKISGIIDDAQSFAPCMPLMSCISDGLAPFFGNRIRAVPMQHRQVDLSVLMQATHTLNERRFQRAILRPPPKPTKHRGIMQPVDRECLPLAAGIQDMHDGIKDCHQRNFALWASCRKRQEGQKKGVKLCLSDFCWNRIPIDMIGNFFI